MRRDREAAAIHRDAVADPDFLCDERRDDLKLRAPIGRMDPEDAADFFDQTGKHELIFRSRRFILDLRNDSSIESAHGKGLASTSVLRSARWNRIC